MLTFLCTIHLQGFPHLCVSLLNMLKHSRYSIKFHVLEISPSLLSCSTPEWFPSVLAVQLSFKSYIHHHNRDSFCHYCFMMTCLLAWVYFHVGPSVGPLYLKTHALQFYKIICIALLMISSLSFSLFYLFRAPITGSLDLLEKLAPLIFLFFSCLLTSLSICSTF